MRYNIKTISFIKKLPISFKKPLKKEFLSKDKTVYFICEFFEYKDLLNLFLKNMVYFCDSKNSLFFLFKKYYFLNYDFVMFYTRISNIGLNFVFFFNLVRFSLEYKNSSKNNKRYKDISFFDIYKRFKISVVYFNEIFMSEFYIYNFFSIFSLNPLSFFSILLFYLSNLIYSLFYLYDNFKSISKETKN